MPVVSVTRFRTRSWRFVPSFLFHAQRAIAQMRRSDGYIAGAVRRDRDLAFWTMTVWRDEQAMMRYVLSGAHRTAMPRLANWGAEASTVRWTMAGDDVPDWATADERMKANGRALALRHAEPLHEGVAYVSSPATFTTRL
ncbi:DUF3291 domain-containing protein [Novosphingobium sp.]|uniref:DUF3291 domain-containing protein n=1 Tax=Novosphingobium sp. TaxID=1874826 RepID=UPI003B51663D